MSNSFVTKQDLDEAVGQISGAIVKALENVATKDDLKNLATKEDLGKVEAELREVKNDVRDLKADTPTAAEFRKLEEKVNTFAQ